MNVKVVFADVGEPLAVRRELRAFARFRRRCKLDSRSGIEAEIPELALRIEEQVLGVWRPHVGSNVVAIDAFFLALIVNAAGGRSKLRELGLADQNFLLAGGRVHIPEFAVLSCFIALNERNLAAIGTPLDGLGSAAGYASFGEDLFDGQLSGGAGRCVLR